MAWRPANRPDCARRSADFSINHECPILRVLSKLPPQPCQLEACHQAIGPSTAFGSRVSRSIEHWLAVRPIVSLPSLTPMLCASLRAAHSSYTFQRACTAARAIPARKHRTMTASAVAAPAASSVKVSDAGLARHLGWVDHVEHDGASTDSVKKLLLGSSTAPATLVPPSRLHARLPAWCCCPSSTWLLADVPPPSFTIACTHGPPLLPAPPVRPTMRPSARS